MVRPARALAVAAAAVSVTVVSGVASAGGAIPRVDVRLAYGPTVLRVRPSRIEVSADGNAQLSHLAWRWWNTGSAVATGRVFVKCYPDLADGVCRARRIRAGFGYELPVVVLLEKPAWTSRGGVFTRLVVFRPDRVIPQVWSAGP